MAKVTAKYETIFIVNPRLDEEARTAIIERFKSLVEANGTLEEVDEWGIRKLAYEIQDEREGYYVLMTFTATPDLPAELDRQLRINDNVMRSIIVCTDEQ